MPYYAQIDDFKNRTDTIDSILPEELNEYTTLSNGLNLKQMRDNAENNLRGLLAALGYTSTDPMAALQDLNNRIKEFHATTASFNGPRLRNEIINPLKGIIINDMQADLNNFQKIMNTKQKELGDVFLQLVDKVTQDLMQAQGVTDAEQILITDIAQELYAQLNQMTFDLANGTISIPGQKSGGGKLIKKEYKELTAQVIKKIKSGIEQANFSGGVDPNIRQLIHKDSNFTRRLLLLAQSQGINVAGIYEQETSPPVFEMTDTDDSLSIYFDILKPFLDVMAPSDSKGTKAEKAAQKYFEGLPPDIQEQEKEKLCIRAIDFLTKFFNTNELSSQRATQLKSKFDQAVRDIIYQYPGALFTGGNEQGVIGILGEIQGLYYIYAILGDLNPSVPPETLVKWIGGDTSAGGGVKTGADLIIELGNKLGYGIQIKNSMDLTGATSFSDFTLNRGDIEGGFINQLINFGISQEIVEAIEDVFVMQSFNISYHLEGTMAVKGSPKGPDVSVYNSTYSKLLKLVDRANRFMALAAVMIMRMQYLEGQGYTQTNTLWLVGGTAIISAVQILDDLIKQINGELSGNIFRSSATTRLEKNSFTIVDYINGAHSELSDLKTVLKTSYNFHKVS